jgi:thiopeptide-type bacteriocin biosynthesis protein
VSPPTPNPPRLEPAGFFMLRTPLLAASVADWLGDGLSAPGTSALADALATDRKAVRSKLAELVARVEVREALFVASPSLLESLPDWLRDPDSDKGEKVERALVRYLYRMSSRSTPFGLFAGCTLGHLGERSHLSVGAIGEHRRHTRLDMDYLFALTRALDGDAAMRGELVYRPNSSLYRIAGELRYVESRMVDSVRSYHLTSVEPTLYLEQTLELAAAGATRSVLADALVDDEITADDALGFVDELIDAQVLISELSPTVTGPEPIHELIAQLAPEGAGGAAGRALAGVRDGLSALDAGPLGADPERYQALAKTLEPLPAPVELARLFQTDLVKPSPDATLAHGVADELVRAVQLMVRLATPPGDPLADMRRAFSERYETREVPLLEVLDEDSGIGFGAAADSIAAEASPLLRGIALGRAEGASTATLRPGEWLLQQRLTAAVRSGKHEIVLDDKDVEALASPGLPPLPSSISMMATLLARSPEALAEGDFRIYSHGANGPSGANLLGRFCHGDAELLERVRAHLVQEEATEPEAVFAEIVHMPEGRVGNVILRPLLRRYELPFLGRSGAPQEQQIPLSDLFLSVSEGRFVLRSHRLGREVIPRLSNAHNYGARSLGVYRFLCTLAGQGMSRSVGFHWGSLGNATFLPRVVYGRVVLSRARWTLTGRQLEQLRDLKGKERYAVTQHLRAEIGLPRWVAVEDADNELLVDLDNVLSVESFVQLVARRSGVTLVEPLAWAEGRCVTGGEGVLTHELVLPLLHRPEGKPEATAQVDPAAAKPVTARAASGAVVRSFTPGSEWLYAKLYTGRGNVDSLLTRLVRPVVSELAGAGVIDRWFFLRYGDPGWHLRLRLHGDPRRLAAEALPALAERLEALRVEGGVWRMQLDTYEREIERYGGPVGIELFERYSHLDSEAALTITEALTGDEASDARWQLALRSMDELLEASGLDLAGRLELLRPIARGYRAEFDVRSAQEKQVGDRYRALRLELEGLLDRGRDADSWLKQGLDALAARAQPMRELLGELREAERAGRLTTSTSDILGSYLHMLANRLLRGAARAQEMVIYSFLERLYEGQIARAKGRGRKG